MELINISNNYLDRFKVIPTPTLFELSYEEKKRILQAKKCYLCGNCLKISLNGDVRCNSVKHLKPFFMRKEKYQNFIK